MRGLWPDPLPAPCSHPSALVYLWLGETQQGCRGACSSRCMAALCSFSSGGEVCLRPGAQLFQDACTGVGRGQEAGRSGVCSGASPARVGCRVASEGWGAPVYSSSRQRCGESWFRTRPHLRDGVGQEAQIKMLSMGPRGQFMLPPHPDHERAPLRGAPAFPKS